MKELKQLTVLNLVGTKVTDAGLKELATLKQLQTLAQTQVRDLRSFLHAMRPVDVDGANLRQLTKGPPSFTPDWSR